MREQCRKYLLLIKYGVFGVLTTLINVVTYAICYERFQFLNVVSNMIAWTLAVLFAFITNKLYVFESKSMKKKTFFREFVKFTVARLATGGLDLGIMFVGVDMMRGPALIFKVISNVIVIILNYVLSRLVVFKT